MVRIGRPSKIDDAKCLELFKQGLNNAQVKREFDKLGVDVTPEAVRLKRIKFEKEYEERGEVAPWKKPTATVAIDIKPTDNEPTLENIEDFLINIREKAAKYDTIEPMYKKMQQALNAKDERIAVLEKEVEYLKQYIKDKDDKALRWRQARQQEEVHSSLESCEQLHSKLHNIYIDTLFFEYGIGIQHNITLDAFCFN